LFDENKTEEKVMMYYWCWLWVKSKKIWKK
jgi:hypothetical protein